MTTCAEMLADLNDRINDAGNTQVPEATKIRYLNHGLRATWPRLYKVVRDATTVLVADTYEYTIPTAVGNNGKILRVELEHTDGRYRHLTNYEIAPHLTLPVLVATGTIPDTYAGQNVRITAAVPLTQFAATGDTYDGPLGTEELPVLYAFGIVMGRRLEDRLDHRRYSTTAAVNGVDTDEIMGASQFAFAQFELLLDRFAMPFPAQG